MAEKERRLEMGKVVRWGGVKVAARRRPCRVLEAMNCMVVGRWSLQSTNG